MSTVLLFLIPLVEYGLIMVLGLVAALSVLKKRCTADMLMAIAGSFCLWLAWSLGFQNKSLANFVIEPLILAGAILSLEIARVMLGEGKIMPRRALAFLNIVASLGLALAILIFMPWLPE